MKFYDQLVAEVGPRRAALLHSKAEHFAKWMQTQPYLKADRRWLNNEGGYNNLVVQLCCEGLTTPENWYDGMRAYYNALCQEYGYDRKRNSNISLDYNLSVVESLPDLLHEDHPLEEVTSEGESLIRSDYTPLNGDVFFTQWMFYLDGLNHRRREILYTWLETRSYQQTAGLLGVDPDEVAATKRAAYAWVWRRS